MKKGIYAGYNKKTQKVEEFENPIDLFKKDSNGNRIYQPLSLKSEPTESHDGNENALVKCMATLGDFSNVRISGEYCAVSNGEPKGGKAKNITKIVLIDSKSKGSQRQHNRVLVGDVVRYRKYHSKFVHGVWAGEIGYDGKPLTMVYEVDKETLKEMTHKEFDEKYGDGSYDKLPRIQGFGGYTKL
jgi:hypothetical protein